MVVKRAGKFSAAVPTSEVTEANYGIYVFVRQAFKPPIIRAYVSSSGCIPLYFLRKCDPEVRANSSNLTEDLDGKQVTLLLEPLQVVFTKGTARN